MSSVSLFERNKPKKTYMAIKELQEYVAASSKVVDAEHVAKKLNDIERLFLAGE